MFRPILLCTVLLLWGSANAAVGGTFFLTEMLLNVCDYWHIMALYIHTFFCAWYQLRDLWWPQQNINGKMKREVSCAVLITWIQLNIPPTDRLENWIVSIFANLGAKKIRSVRASPTFQRVSGAVISARLAAIKKNPRKRFRGRWKETQVYLPTKLLV